MAQNPYNEILYETPARFTTHPDRLAAVARLFGMEPAPVDRCRYLEIGCGNGNHIVSMAYHLPESQFTGVDLAEVPIANGERMRDALKIGNLTLRAGDLRDIGAEWGEFDYIATHGVYSWVSAEVRDALMRVCKERLAPNGVAFIDYSTLPGCYIRQFLRDLMLFHTRDTQDPNERLRQARWSLQFVAGSPLLPDAWRPLIESDVARLLELGDAWLFHDDFSTYNDPVYFHQFAAHAARHGLQYLGEADPSEMFDTGGALKAVPGGLIEREQYMDFLRVRRFRQTLLCHQSRTLKRGPLEDRMDRFLFSSRCHPLEDGRIEGLREVRIIAKHDAVHRIAAALGEEYPLPVSFDDLIPYCDSEAALRDILSGMVLSGFADFHVHRFPCQKIVSPAPAASRLARYQSLDSPRVANACFHVLELDDLSRQLVRLLDGSRTHRQIAAEFARVPGAKSLEEIEQRLPATLEWLARAALLES
ncbi:MAG TPA: class I SAM-dependent methyltransferase [Bryobacteraceae bacterium]